MGQYNRMGTKLDLKYIRRNKIKVALQTLVEERTAVSYDNLQLSLNDRMNTDISKDSYLDKTRYKQLTLSFILPT